MIPILILLLAVLAVVEADRCCMSGIAPQTDCAGLSQHDCEFHLPQCAWGSCNSMKDSPSPWDSVFVKGAYTDPNHPSCPRFIMPYDPPSEGKTYYTDGYDNVNGEGVSCFNAAAADIQSWGPLPTFVNGTSVVVDFSSKGGPSNLHGDWKETTEKKGILWEDGNFWTQIQAN